MSSTFFGLQIAYSGLKASNANLNTTGNNISNVDTEGYSRQETITEAATPLRAYESYGCVGAGVDTLSVDRIRDAFYDEKYRDNETRLGEAERKEYYMSIMETYFTDDGDNGFKSIFNDMIDAMEEVTKNSSSTSTKAQYVASVKSLTDYFNNMAGDLQDLQKDINDEIKIQVGQINSIAQEIATINKQINIIELSGATANELRDKRDLLMDDLSKYVDVEVNETPIYDGAGEETGATRYIVKIAGGQTLVDQNEYNTLTCVARTSAEKVNLNDADGLYDIYWEDNEEFRLDNASMGGSLKALGDLRDGNNGEWFQGTVTGTGSVSSTVTSTDASGNTVTSTVTNTTVTIKTTADYLSNISKCNLSDTGGKIVIGATEYYYKNWTAETDSDGNILSYTFIMDDASCTNDPRKIQAGKEAKMGSQSDYQGIPYYMSQMNEWVRLFADSVNDVFSAEGQAFTADGEQADILVTGQMANTGTAADGTIVDQFNKDILENNTAADAQKYNYDGNRRYYYLTALNVAVSDEITEDADKLGARAVESDGVDECDNVYTAMSNLQDKSKLSFRGYNASGFLEAVLSDVALNTSNARTFTDSYTNLEKTLENQRTSISGVDSDEEALNLVKYENAYTLASKMIQVFSEIYDRLILETGV